MPIRKLLSAVTVLSLLTTLSVTAAEPTVDDAKLAVAKQRIRCGKTAFIISQMTTKPGMKEVYSGLALSLGEQARRAGVTDEMSQAWSRELSEQIQAAPDEKATLKVVEDEIGICNLYGMFSLATASK